LGTGRHPAGRMTRAGRPGTSPAPRAVAGRPVAGGLSSGTVAPGAHDVRRPKALDGPWTQPGLVAIRMPESSRACGSLQGRWFIASAEGRGRLGTGSGREQPPWTQAGPSPPACRESSSGGPAARGRWFTSGWASAARAGRGSGHQWRVPTSVAFADPARVLVGTSTGSPIGTGITTVAFDPPAHPRRPRPPARHAPARRPAGGGPPRGPRRHLPCPGRVVQPTGEAMAAGLGQVGGRAIGHAVQDRLGQLHDRSPIGRVDRTGGGSPGRTGGTSGRPRLGRAADRVGRAICHLWLTVGRSPGRNKKGPPQWTDRGGPR